MELFAAVDIVSTVAEFVDDNQYLFFASVSRGWRDVWGKRPTVTKALTADTSVPQLSLSFECGLRRTAAVCETVAGLGRLDLLRRARAMGCQWNENTCYVAAKAGHLHVLVWARQNGCRWGRNTAMGAARTSVEAAEGGHVHVLQWLRDNGCALGPSTCAGAARFGSSEKIEQPLYNCIGFKGSVKYERSRLSERVWRNLTSACMLVRRSLCNTRGPSCQAS
ncbi:unnamed protein product [Ectocarpus sp. CCAP 1310/34]|nr:unnamed protein product [Ectocarpus sp. CCAP 1310/34]